MKERIQYLDFSRGLLIFIVVLTHCWFLHTNLLFFWDVQVFFILSGIFLSSSNTIDNTLVNRVKGLVYPFLFFSVPVYAIFYVYNLFRGNVSSFNFLFPDSYGLGTEWFLIVLAVDVFVYLIINQMAFKWGGLVTLYFALAFWTYKIDDTQNYLVMAGVTLPLLFFGSFYKKFADVIEKYKYWVLLLSIFVIGVYAYFKCDINIIWMQMSVDPASYFIISVAGFLLIITFSIIFQVLSMHYPIFDIVFDGISKWGFNSLYILVIHWSIRLIISRLNARFDLLDYYSVFTSILLAVVLCAVSCQIGIGLKRIKYFNRFLK